MGAEEKTSLKKGGKAGIRQVKKQALPGVGGNREASPTYEVPGS